MYFSLLANLLIRISDEAFSITWCKLIVLWIFLQLWLLLAVAVQKSCFLQSMQKNNKLCDYIHNIFLIIIFPYKDHMLSSSNWLKRYNSLQNAIHFLTMTMFIQSVLQWDNHPMCEWFEDTVFWYSMSVEPSNVSSCNLGTLCLFSKNYNN